MKKIITALILTASLSVAAKECIVEVKNLSIRGAPSITSKKIGNLKAGVTVNIIKEKKDWYYIGIGWIKKDYCSVLTEDNKGGIKKAIKMGSILPDGEGSYPQIIDSLYSYASISLTDVSRITCPKEIKWFTYSKEKEIQIQKAKNNLLVKISPKVLLENGQVKKIKRSTFPRELLVECGGQIFTLILIPKRVPTQTIILKPKFVNKQKAIKFETANPYEETIKNLIKSVYKENLIDGYEIKEVNKLYKSFKRLDMIKRKEYIGAYYKITEYTLIAKKDIDLHEKLFLPYLSDKTLAIALSQLHLRKGEKGRLFVVEKEEG